MLEVRRCSRKQVNEQVQRGTHQVTQLVQSAMSASVALLITVKQIEDSLMRESESEREKTS